MKKLFKKLSVTKFTLMVALAAMLIPMYSGLAQKIYNKPEAPVLSLNGAGTSYDKDWYPDGRLWTPPSPSVTTPREILVPVFIDNKWATYSQTAEYVKADPIYSFEFRMMYDNTALEYVGVQMTHPISKEEATLRNDVRFVTNTKKWYEPLAAGFNIQVNDVAEPYFKQNIFDYKNSFVPSNSSTTFKNDTNEAKKGRLLRFLGTSLSPLPNTDLTKEDYKVLFYVKFKVKNTVGVAGTSNSDKNTPLYLDWKEIKYNGWDVTKDAPFAYLRKVDPKVMALYPPYPYDPVPFETGLAGVNNYRIKVGQVNAFDVEPTMPGMIYLRVSDKLPKFAFDCSRGKGSIIQIQPNATETEWTLNDPITVDQAQVAPTVGLRAIRVYNKTSDSRLTDVIIESDQPWLKVVMAPGNKYTSKPKTPAQPAQLTRHGYINFIDNGLFEKNDPELATQAADGDCYLEITCDPSLLDPNNAVNSGIYYGTITFYSNTAEVSPVKLKVTFINFENPVESNRSFKSLNETKNGKAYPVTPGINLWVSNSDATAPGAQGYSKKLIFGTGTRATKYVDSLYGEYGYTTPMDESKFNARWYLWPVVFPQDSIVKYNLIEGFGDFASSDEYPRSESRDIRSTKQTRSSIYYYCKFAAGGADKYPIVVEWNTDDFMVNGVDNSQLYIRTILNGKLQQSLNMREATSTGNGNYSFTITDARIKEFVIEYTLPQVIDYVGKDGNPIIKHGWNFLSLPVRPTNSEAKQVYKNSMNEPLAFAQNLYQNPANGILQVGAGYFVKYNQIVDTKFAGTLIYEIDKEGPNKDEIRLYPGSTTTSGVQVGGWNAIGALSFPVSTDYIDFTEFYLSANVKVKPSQTEMRKAGVWGYKTDKGYYQVAELLPGLGYWIKVDNNGYYKLNLPYIPVEEAEEKGLESFDNSFARFNVKDNAQHFTTLFDANVVTSNLTGYELPPVPPMNLFDVRFNDNMIAMTSEESVIKLQGVEYPVAISVENANANYTFVDAVTGQVFGTIPAGSTENVEIPFAAYNAVKVIKTENTNDVFAAMVTPNPTNNEASVKFNVPANGNVTVKLYNALGNEVATIVNNEFVNAGAFARNINVSNLATGSYIVKINVNGASSTVKVNVVK